MSDRKALVRLVLSFVVGGIFIYSGVVKAIDPMRFANDIENYRLLAWPIGMRFALYLPWLEIFCGLALIVGWMRSGAVAILTAAITVFIGLSIVTRARGINLDCGCFGSVGKGLGFSAHLAIDFAILAALIVLWFLPPRVADR
ncbi:MAG: MauE/DoxX family redox-associated membrane protein [Chthoniobacterales bacterium]